MAAIDIFGKHADVWATYAAEVQITHQIIGGIPKDPDTIQKWLRSRLEMEDRALIELAEEVAVQMEESSGARPNADELLGGISKAIGAGNGFKSVDGQLVFEGRCVKGGLKEAANIIYPVGTSFPGRAAIAGLTSKGGDVSKKGLMKHLAERVFVPDQYIPLGVSAASGTEQRIKHISDKNGKRSAINIVDYVNRPRLSFTVRVLDDFMPPEVWGRLWAELEDIGFGSDRARSDGKFTLERWERI